MGWRRLASGTRLGRWLTLKSATGVLLRTTVEAAKKTRVGDDAAARRTRADTLRAGASKWKTSFVGECDWNEGHYTLKFIELARKFGANSIKVRGASR